MARGRMLSALIAEDVEFNNMSMEAQFMFMRTIPHLDRDGLINGHPFILHGKIAPLMPQLGAMMESIIDEWISAGMVINYSAGNTRILFFKNFSKNQVGMRYDRESASTFPPPPGYERTKDGLQPITNAPKIPPPQTPPTSNGYHPQESGKSPARVRQESGETPPEVELEDQLEDKGGSNTSRARVTEQPQQPQQPQPPPLSSKQPTASTGDPLMDAASNRFKKKQVDGHRKANRSGAWPELDKKVAAAVRLPLVERLIDMHGLRAAIDVAEDDYKLADMHRLAADLYVMGFTTIADIETVYAQFKKEWRGKTPAGRQLATIASNMKQQPGQSPPIKAVLPLGKWCLQKYGVDRPKFVQDVPETLINEQYEQYKRQYQQAH